MKALVTYNPKSGTQKITKNQEIVKSKLEEAGYEVEFFPSPAPKSITEYIKNNGNNYDLILTSGGDGTLNETVTGMMQGDVKTKLAYIPAGTVNDVGKILKLKKDVKKGLDIATKGVPVKLDIVKINDNYSAYIIAAGKFTAISYDIEYKSKKRWGKLAYGFRLLREIPKKSGMRLRLTFPDGKTYSNCYVVFGFNWQQFGGFKIYRRNKPLLNDGKMDITVIEKTKHLSMFRLMNFVLLGERLRKKAVRTFTCDKVKIECDREIDYNVDGEFAFTSKEAMLEVKKQAISIIVPYKTYKKLFDNEFILQSDKIEDIKKCKN